MFILSHIIIITDYWVLVYQHFKTNLIYICYKNIFLELLK